MRRAAQNTYTNAGWTLTKRVLAIGFALICTFSKVAFSEAAFSKSLNHPLILSDKKFGQLDGVAVARLDGTPIYRWNADKKLMIASLSKLLTARLAIQRWGLEHQFHTDFYVQGRKLYVKGFGDPFLISEEIEKLAAGLILELNKREVGSIESIHLDADFFQVASVPGRSKVADPYNAPLSAISANFNTAMLRRVEGHLQSAEAQTPLTKTALNVARASAVRIGNKAQRINLVSQKNSVQNFAEILVAKMDLQSAPQIVLNASIPEPAVLVYKHINSNSLATVLRGTLEFSNNFIANQLYLMVAANNEQERITFSQAQRRNRAALRKLYGWQEISFPEGAGLSRKNQLSALQLEQVLAEFKDYKFLLKRYSVKIDSMPKPNVVVHAKTGTLSNVHSFAGFIDIGTEQYTFVFLFNRVMPYRYRLSLLETLVEQLAQAKP